MQILLILLILNPDSLPWRGRIVFGDWVRVDDTDTLSSDQNHPIAVIDPDGSTFAVWQDQRSATNYEIYFARSLDTCRTFSRPNLNISQNPGYDDLYPWIAKDKVGNLFAVWQAWVNNEWKIYFTRSTDNGVSFIPADTVTGVVVQNDQNSGVNFGPQPRIVAAPDTSILYLLWADGMGNQPTRICCARSTDLGSSFFGQVVVNSDTTSVARHPSGAAFDSGMIYCVYEQGSGQNQDPHPDVYMNYSLDYGASFDTAIIVNDDPAQSHRRLNPSISVDSASNVLTVWEDSRPPAQSDDKPFIFFARNQAGEDTFSVNEQVNFGSGIENYRPTLAIDPTGILVAAWHSNRVADTFGIYMCAYSDSLGAFSPAQLLVNSYTGQSGANFGNSFYPPSLSVTMLDTVTNFFLVWEDLSEDALGNIYAVRGWVEEIFSDIDIHDDSIDVSSNTINLGAVPAGPPDAIGRLFVACTDDSLNPDPDGPSLDSVNIVMDTIFTLIGPQNETITGAVLGLPSELGIGQGLVCSVGVYIPEGKPNGTYTGYATIKAVGKTYNDTTRDSVLVMINGPLPENNLDSLRVFPNPYKPHRMGHKKIYFYGLTDQATITIFDIAGSRVKVIKEPEDDGVADGLATWGGDVSSGLYLYIIDDRNGHIRKGRISILR